MTQSAGHVPEGSVSARLGARMAAAIAESETAPEASSPASSPAATDASEAVSASDGIGSGPGGPGETSTSEAPTQADEGQTRLALLREKLAEQRAKNEARRLRKQLAEEHKAAEEEKRKAREEREQVEGISRKLREGSFKDALTELGRDPRKTFEEMQREAVEAGTPEGQIRLLQRQLLESQEETRRAIEELRSARSQDVEAQRREREAMQEQAIAARFQADFVKTLQDPGYSVLREAYEDGELFVYAEGFRRNPKNMITIARECGVRLTAPEKGFTMREILDVLKAAQDQHDAKRQERRARLTGQQPAKSPTVNGTTERKGNAGSTVGNDLASARATSGRPKLSRAERIEAEIRRQEGR